MLSTMLKWAPDPTAPALDLPPWAQQLVDLGALLGSHEGAGLAWRVVVDAPTALFAAPLVGAGFTWSRFRAASRHGDASLLTPALACALKPGQVLMMAVTDGLAKCRFVRIEDNGGVPYLVVHDDGNYMDRAFPLEACSRFLVAGELIADRARLPTGGLGEAAFGSAALGAFLVAGSVDCVIIGPLARLASELSDSCFAVLDGDEPGIGPLDDLVLAGVAAGVPGALRTLVAAPGGQSPIPDAVALVIVEGAAAAERALPRAPRSAHHVVVIGSTCADLRSAGLIGDFNSRYYERIGGGSHEMAAILDGPLDVMAFQERGA